MGKSLKELNVRNVFLQIYCVDSVLKIRVHPRPSWLKSLAPSARTVQLSFQLRASRYTAGDALAANTRREPVFVRQPVAGQSVLRLAHARHERQQRGERRVPLAEIGRAACR